MEIKTHHHKYLEQTILTVFLWAGLWGMLSLLIDNGFQGKEGQQIPEMSDAWVNEISERYIELYEKVTGDKFIKHPTDNLLERVEKNILKALN